VSDDGGARAQQRRARSETRRRKKAKRDEASREASGSTNDEVASANEPSKAAPPKRKRKRKRKRRDDAAKPTDDRPPFARVYPHHDALDRLVAAFDRGDFALVRSEIPAILDGDEDESVKRAAADLRRRLDPAPTSVFLWALGVALLVFLFGYYVSHSH